MKAGFDRLLAVLIIASRFSGDNGVP